MAIGLYIIGDEIMSGKRTDQHFPKVVQILRERGLQLSWAQYLGDDPARITAALERSFASSDIVFSCGGIGATPDDHTRQCAAAVLGKELVLHPQAKQIIRARIVEVAQKKGLEVDLEAPENLHRLKMGEFPEGAEIIPNPFNKIPGFACASHYFVPGFPEMAWPMIEWVLDTHYADSFHQVAFAEQAMLLFDVAESAITPLMEQIERDFPLVKVFRLPSVGKAQLPQHIELGVKGEPEQVKTAFALLHQEVAKLNTEIRLL